MDIHIEGHHDSYWMAHVLEKPGCIWINSDKDRLVSEGPEAIRLYKLWLERNGEPKSNKNYYEKLEIAAVHEIPGFGVSGVNVALFNPDYSPISSEEILRVIRILGYARRELLEIVTSLPVQALDWQPPEGERTLRQNLEHVRDSQGYYLSRLLGKENVESKMSRAQPKGTMESLNWMQENTIRILLEWPTTLYGGVYQAEKPLENWTPRKMLRRILEHEREHIWVIRNVILPLA